MTNELLNLPWQIQVALASGYGAYLMSYTGIRSHHRAIDTTFITLVFGLIATAILGLGTVFEAGGIASGITAFAVTVLVGLWWRKWGRSALRWVLRRLDVSWSDDDPSALASISANTNCYLSQIAVLTEDGTWLRCDDTTKFKDAPFGPCLIGPNGDVALYLTHEEPPGKRARKLKTVRDSYYGDRLTYVPAPRIKRVALRYRSRR
jgi:hypothetical protein